MINKDPIVFIDETTFNSSQCPKKGWVKYSRETFVVPQPSKIYTSVTVFRGISKVRDKPVYTFGESTNTREFCLFLIKLREAIGTTEYVYIVLDSASAHKSNTSQ